MERQDLVTTHEGDTMPTPLADGSRPGTSENTRLFDIRTLANHTKERISKQMESQQAAEVALLSSATLSMTAVPVMDVSQDYDPFRVPVEGTFDVAIEGTPAPSLLPKSPAVQVAAPSAMPMGTGSVTAATSTASMAAKATPALTAPMPSFGAGLPMKKPTSLWVYVIALAVIGGGVGGYFVYKSKAANGAEVAAAATPTEVAEAAPAEEAPKVEPLVEPVAQPLEEAIEPEPEPAAEGDTGAMVKDDDQAKKDEDKADKRKNYKRDQKPDAVASDDSALRDALEDRKLKEKKSDKPVVDTSDTKKDIDELLDQAAVGTVLKKAVVEEPKKPSKTSLSRSDVMAAMSKVSGKAKGCYNLFEQAGTVKVRFTVSPQGKVTKAAATGKFQGTDTGKCVAQAVSKATFPEYDGAPKTISYPFLLSP